MQNINKYVKALSAIWLIISFIISSSITANSDASGIKSIFLFFGCIAGFSFPVWLYFIGFYLWGDGYMAKCFHLLVSNPLKKIIRVTIGFIQKITIFGWICAVLFASSVGVSVYFLYHLNKINFYQIGVLIGEHLIPFLICAGSMKMKATPLKKTLIFCLFLFLLFVVLRMDYEAYRYANEYSESRLKSDIELTNQKLPMMIDDYTRLDSLYVKGNGISYKYTLVKTTAEDLDILRFKSAMIPSLKLKACSDEEAKALLDRDKDVSYEYFDKNGQQMLILTINKKDCL